jgi:hypothetical protein
MDIINIFQAICKKYINNTEDAGCGMRNLYVSDYIVQVYPNDEYHNVWFLDHDDDGLEVVSTIESYTSQQQIQWLEDYYKEITKGKTEPTNLFSDILIGIAAGGCELGKIFYMKKTEREEYIQAEIMNWDVEDITKFMQELGNWDENTLLVSYSPNMIAELVQKGIENGWDIKVEIERGRDYFLFAKEKKQTNYFSTYEITGHIDEFDEIAGIIDIWGVVGGIMNNTDKMSKFMEFAKKIREKTQKNSPKFV